jgi:hypothetical protein
VCPSWTALLPVGEYESARAGCAAMMAAGCALLGCAAGNEAVNAPGYNVMGTTGVAKAEISPQASVSALPTGALWTKVGAVESFREVFRGKTKGHEFPGNASTTVSTRVSEPGLVDVLHGLATFSELEPGATVSQLVFSDGNSNQWTVAYVAERKNIAGIAAEEGVDTNDPLPDVAFYVVSPDGRIDASARTLCASCHVQRYAAWLQR